MVGGREAILELEFKTVILGIVESPLQLFFLISISENKIKLLSIDISISPQLLCSKLNGGHWECWCLSAIPLAIQFKGPPKERMQGCSVLCVEGANSRLFRE